MSQQGPLDPDQNCICTIGASSGTDMHDEFWRLALAIAPAWIWTTTDRGGGAAGQSTGRPVRPVDR